MDRSHKTFLSRAEARESIRKQGITVKQWSKERGLKSKTVFEVLSGRNRGHWGEAHRAAVLLGIKDGVLND